MRNSTLQRLSFGTHTFSSIRNEGDLYVDKTEDIYNLITQGCRYFLARPRGFGKSLLTTTMEEIFAGNKALFKNLWIESSDYSWQPHGVISLSFLGLDTKNIDSFEYGIIRELSWIAKNYGITESIHATSPGIALHHLTKKLHERFGKVAILIDAYDIPILLTLEDQKKAEEIWDSMEHFLTVVKSLDEYMNFIFVTGVSALIKAGIFSGFNNLKTITFDKRSATICGYTDQEIDHYFAPHIQAWADTKNVSYDNIRQQIREWYGGYRFGDSELTVYDPSCVMRALDNQNCANFWLEFGHPSALKREINKHYHTLEHEILHLKPFEATENCLDTFEIEKTPLIASLFQKGYLTIKNVSEESLCTIYTLDYPNYGLRLSAAEYFLSVFMQTNLNEAMYVAFELQTAFRDKDIDKMVRLIKSVVVSDPYQAHIAAIQTPFETPIPEEKFYYGLLYILFIATRLKVYSKYKTDHTRTDIFVELPSVNYVIELKFNKSAKKALEQIENRKYYEALQHQNKPIILLGLNFHRKPNEFDITYASKEVQ